MKKFIAFCLTLCLALSCTSVAFAAEPANIKRVSPIESVTISPRNVDYWNTNGPMLLDGAGKVTLDNIPAGKNLKVHFNMLSGGLRIFVREKGSSWIIKTVTFTKAGHNYADLVKNTSGKSFTNISTNIYFFSLFNIINLSYFTLFKVIFNLP